MPAMGFAATTCAGRGVGFAADFREQSWAWQVPAGLNRGHGPLIRFCLWINSLHCRSRPCLRWDGQPQPVLGVGAAQNQNSAPRGIFASAKLLYP